MRWIFPLIFCSILRANPQGHTVMNGEAHISENGSLLEVKTDDRTVIHWDSFSIQAGETTHFIQPSIDSAVLNKVVGPDMSQINGSLQANGQVYLVNPNGVLIGPDGRIDTAAFMATALDIQSGEFLNGEALCLFGYSEGNIVNLGIIETPSGPVTLIGHRIENAGEILAPTANLIAGHSVLFDPTGDSILYIQPDLKSDGIDMSGSIHALKTLLQADTPPTTLAIGLGGLVDATAVACVGGEIYLSAKSGDIIIDGDLMASEKVFAQAEMGTMELRGEIEAPSGEVRILGKTIHLMGNSLIDVSGDTGNGAVLIGGDYQGKNPEISNAEYVYCDPTAEVRLDAKISGDGGKAIFWGDQAIGFYGKVSAKGGPEGGNGGFVEVSSPGHFSFGGLVCTLAPKGTTGTLLLDPTDITISTAATTASFAGMTYFGVGASANINNTELSNNLALSNVTISTASGGGALGNITLNAPVTWNANELSLTLNANLAINADLTLGGSASFSLSSVQDVVMTNATINFSSSASSFTLGAPGLITVTNSQFNCTTNAQITFDGSEMLQFDNSIVSNTGNGLMSFISGGLSNIQFINSTSISSTGGSSIVIQANGASGNVFLNSDSSISTTGSGTITIEASGVSGQVHLGDSTITCETPLTISPNAALNMSGTINLNIPQQITFTSVSSKPFVLGGPATINTTTSLLSFPLGVDSSPTSLTRDLTIHAVNGSISFGGSCFLSAADINAGSSIDIQGLFDVQLTNLSLNAGSNINLFDATVQGVAAVNLVAGNNLVGNGIGTIQTVNANDLILVSDNQFPSSPDFGTGVFQLSGYTLQTNSGLGTDNNIVFLYASTPILYTASPISGFLPSTINGLGHTFGSFSGTDYSKGTHEFLFTYFPNLPVDPPSFELIFKVSGISSTTIQTIQIAVTEPVSNPPQITQVIEGSLSTPSSPNPQTPCRTPPVSVQAL